ncbi:Annexin [Lophium mytilinum]|uniref:Annexin n=1 Tax=Lophium mytilinum TaxID=390894 RepID=A0A6A6QAG5_9PEZI|nr:Annexin [Lophium mytilinum]
MSLRVDDRKGRSRSKSRDGGKRDRSRSNVRAPSPSPAAYSYAAPGQGGVGATPQYEVRQPSQPSAQPHGYVTPAHLLGGASGGHRAEMSAQSNAPPPPMASDITMGDYTDLPPHERPGYIQQQQQQQQAQQYQYPNQPQDRGPASPTSPSYAYGQPVSYSQAPQYGYTPNAANQSGPQRAAGGTGGFQYAPAPDKITFTSKPVVSSAQQPPIKHSAQPAALQYQQPQSYDYTSTPQHGQRQPSPPQAQYQHAHPQSQAQYQQAPPPPQAQYQQPLPPQAHYQPSPPPIQQSAPSHSRKPSGYYGDHAVVEIVPGGSRMPQPPSPGLHPHRMSVNGPRPDLRAPSPGMPRMDRLSVSGNRPDIQQILPGQAPPGSPLLEAYHGVYQSISPMPSAMMIPDDDLDDLPMLNSLSPRDSTSSIHGRHRATSTSSRHRAPSTSGRHPSPPSKGRKGDKLALEAMALTTQSQKEKRVKIYDATEDALALVDALASRTPNVDTLIDILPMLSHDQMLELRAEYKRHCKVQGRGINIAKHIKLKIPSSNFGKICHVTALGKYESEGYWANFWYQSSNARRELLVEALMGRQNHEIREIKDAFKDKRYGDSLTKCMDKELKADKFRKAVLMALEGERQEESDQWPMEYRNKDVDTLYKALKAREGGETAMLGVVVMRSDQHLREVLRTYERKYQGNFARDALRKSNNLVGEVIAHILNGAINRPARDSMLLHHALMDLIEPPEPAAPGPRSSSSKLSKESVSKHERQQRYELLISRLVRLHWDRLHMIRVKAEYEEKYGRVIEEDLEEATKGDFREFCIALCQTGR